MNKYNELNISICVVLYRSEEGTIRFHQELLESLRNCSNFEIRYYDNSPTDALRKPLSTHQNDCAVSYFHDSRNLGFSYANNVLILNARYKKILLLNPDVYGFNANVWELIGSYSVSKRVIFAKLLNPDGSFQDCIGDIVSIRRALVRRLDYSAVDSKIIIGMGIMAFMLTEKEVYAHVGLLDTDYSLYAEDMDWCYRATQKGYELIYEPTITLTHTGGASAKNRWSYGESLRKKYAAEIVFVNKHTKGFYWVVMRTFSALKILKSYIRF